MRRRNHPGVIGAHLHPVAPAVTPHSSFGAWLALAIVLALVLACGVVLGSRR